jgi:hypothetical protein
MMFKYHGDGDDAVFHSVLVEVDSIENLKATYPNYFGDVQMFRTQLRAITQGEQVVEYEMPRRIASPRTSPREKPDDSWLGAVRKVVGIGFGAFSG